MNHSMKIATREGTVLGKAVLMNDGRTFTYTAPSWAVNSLYRCLIQNGAHSTSEWMCYKHMQVVLYMCKDFTPTDNIYFLDYHQAEMRGAFGEHVFDNCVMIKFLVNNTYTTLNKMKANAPFDKVQYIDSVMSKYKDRVTLPNGTAYDLWMFPYQYVKVVPRAEKWKWGDKPARVIDLEFYDAEDRCVLRMISGCADDTTCVKGEYCDERVPTKPKTIKTNAYLMTEDIPVMPDYGCVDCKDSEYHIHDGVYLRCTLCGKEVKEIEYDGTHYPDYCTRAIAKKIRTYEARKASMRA